MIQSYAATPAPGRVNVGHAPAPAAAARRRRAAETPADAFDAELGAALDAAGYPAKADPARVNTPMVVLLLWCW